jgi:hypothetical protein
VSALRSSLDKLWERAVSSTVLLPSWVKACERAEVSFLTFSLEGAAAELLPWAMRWTEALARVSEDGWK